MVGAVTAYRYWITYEGRVEAANEDEARDLAFADAQSVAPIIDLEAEGEDVEL